MIDVGEVTALNDGYATVKVNRKDECSKCGMCLFPKNSAFIEINAKNEIKAKVGDKVRIEKRESASFISTVLAFFVPLLLIGVSFLIGNFVIKKELWILFLSLIFIVLWYLFLAFIDNKLKRLKQFENVIVEVYGRENKDE